MIQKIDSLTTLQEALNLSVQIQLSIASREVKEPLIKLVEAKIALLNKRQQFGNNLVVSSELKEGDL